MNNAIYDGNKIGWLLGNNNNKIQEQIKIQFFNVFIEMLMSFKAIVNYKWFAFKYQIYRLIKGGDRK